LQSEINSSVMACGSLCSGLVVAIVISTSCLVRSSASCQLLLYWPEGKQGFGRRWRFVVITAAVHLIHLSIGPICHARWKLNFVHSVVGCRLAVWSMDDCLELVIFPELFYYFKWVNFCRWLVAYRVLLIDCLLYSVCNLEFSLLVFISSFLAGVYVYFWMWFGVYMMY